MTRPMLLTPPEAARVLALCDLAESRAPSSPYDWLRGFVTYASIVPLPFEREAEATIERHSGQHRRGKP